MPRKTKQNDITSPELLSQINPKNKRLMKDYLLYLKSIQRAETTINSYQNDLEIFFVWLFQNADNKFFASITKRDVIAFQNYLLNENGNSPARVRRIKATLSSLSNYIENVLDDDDEFKGFKNIIHKIESPVNQPVREKTILSEEDISQLLNYLVEKKKYQKACLFALAAASGRRKSELVRFKTSYFEENNILFGSLYKTPEAIRTKGRGNGKYLYVYTLVSFFKPYLDLWVSERERLGINSEWLFVKKEKNGTYSQLSPETVTSWFNTFSKILGKDVYCHCLRHFFTTHLSASGIPDSVIADIIGWDSIEMTKIYNDRTADSQIADYFDENGIKQNVSKSLSDL